MLGEECQVGQIVLRMLRMSDPSQLSPADRCQDLNSCSFPLRRRGPGAGARTRSPSPLLLLILPISSLLPQPAICVPLFTLAFHWGLFSCLIFLVLHSGTFTPQGETLCLILSLHFLLVWLIMVYHILLPAYLQKLVISFGVCARLTPRGLSSVI